MKALQTYRNTKTKNFQASASGCRRQSTYRAAGAPPIYSVSPQPAAVDSMESATIVNIL